MTWQLGALAVLGVALAAGFGWYERARPDSRIVALVGTLAAFAALGRIAFAAVPNVKPTTDIVLVAGYALGGGPGFAVGALAGLTSNFFFGQGPWTPWQMAAWGATGMIGAGLALTWGRRIGRWPLAIACGVCGFGFTVVQDCGDWVTYSDHSLTQLGLYVGRGLGLTTRFPRDRLHRLRARLRPGADPLSAALLPAPAGHLVRAQAGGHARRRVRRAHRDPGVARARRHGQRGSGAACVRWARRGVQPARRGRSRSRLSGRG